MNKISTEAKLDKLIELQEATTKSLTALTAILTTIKVTQSTSDTNIYLTQLLKEADKKYPNKNDPSRFDFFYNTVEKAIKDSDNSTLKFLLKEKALAPNEFAIFRMLRWSCEHDSYSSFEILTEEYKEYVMKEDCVEALIPLLLFRQNKFVELLISIRGRLFSKLSIYEETQMRALIKI